MREYNSRHPDIFKNIKVEEVGGQDLMSQNTSNRSEPSDDPLHILREGFVEQMRTQIRENGGVDNTQFVF